VESTQDMAHDGTRQSAELLRTKQLAFVGICQDIIYRQSYFHTIGIVETAFYRLYRYECGFIIQCTF